MEKPENPSELEDLKTIYKWIKKNNKFLTYIVSLILFFWYLNPMIKESRYKNICASNLSNTKGKNPKEAGEKLGLKSAEWREIIRFCQFYKSSERYIDADIDGSIKTYPYR